MLATERGHRGQPVTNTACVANAGSSILSVIGGGTNTLTWTVAVGVVPVGVAVNPLTGSVYVMNFRAASVGRSHRLRLLPRCQKISIDRHALGISNITLA